MTALRKPIFAIAVVASLAALLPTLFFSVHLVLGPVAIGTQSRGVYVAWPTDGSFEMRISDTDFDHRKLMQLRPTLMRQSILIRHFTCVLVTWGLYLWMRNISSKHPRGHCQQCGYDLTGNTTGFCPECNTKVVA